MYCFQSVRISWFGVRMKCISLFDGSVLGITLVLTGTDQLSDYVNRKMEEKNYLCSESTPDAKKQTVFL
jgi:hypothetical protein